MSESSRRSPKIRRLIGTSFKILMPIFLAISLLLAETGGVVSGSSSTLGQKEAIAPQSSAVAPLGHKIPITLKPGEEIGITSDCKGFFDILLRLIADEGMPGLGGAMLSVENVAQSCNTLMTHRSREKITAAFPLEFGGMSGGWISAEPAAVLQIYLQQGPLRAEVVNDQVSLEIETATATISSVGMNIFDVAFDPASGRTLVATHDIPISIQPTGGEESFALQPGQMVVIHRNGTVASMGGKPAGAFNLSDWPGAEMPFKLDDLQ
jgi:hypothetical protein